MGTRSTRIVRRLGAATACLPICLAAAAPASGAPGPAGWGPAAIRYVNGVVCDTAQGSRALVSWPSPLTDPAFARAPVVGPPAGSAGTFGTPAVAATTSQTLPDSAEAAALAYLIHTHGSLPDPATVGDVAAVVAGRRGADPLAGACLAAHTRGLDAVVARSLWSEAQRLAGPYRVSVQADSAKLVLGSSVSLTARVLSATGDPVPGLVVTFSTSDPGAGLAATTATTDALGAARTELSLATGSASTSVHVDATVSAPVGLVQLAAPGTVALVTPDSAREFTATRAVPVDTTADPKLAAHAEPSLVLPGGSVRTSLGVTGMRGHDGTASARLVGPLPFVKDVGCGRYRDRDWRALGSGAGASALGIAGDGSYQGATTKLDAPGCYRVTAQLATTNATPNVTHTSGAGDVVTVAPVAVTQSPGGHGVAVAGPLTSTLRISGPTRASLTDVHGELLGPRLAAGGVCPARGWGSTPAAATLDASTGHDTGSVTLTSAAQTRGDCYGFRVRARVSLPHIGSVPVELGPSRTRDAALVLAPAVTVTALSSTAVQAGGRLAATVSVTGTLTQPSELRIELRHLPNSWRGCFGRDWRDAASVAQHENDPVVTTHGDDTYTVITPAVPTDGCWTPVPVLSLRADPAISVRGLPMVGTMTAFTGTRTSAITVRHDDGSDDPLATARLLLAVSLMFALLVGAVVGTWIAARRMVTVARSEPFEQLRL